MRRHRCWMVVESSREDRFQTVQHLEGKGILGFSPALHWVDLEYSLGKPMGGADSKELSGFGIKLVGSVATACKWTYRSNKRDRRFLGISGMRLGPGNVHIRARLGRKREGTAFPWSVDLQWSFTRNDE